jgi:5-methylcytosine-specific restriction protein A
MTEWLGSTNRQRLGARSGWDQRALARRVIERDQGICYLCGKPGADNADHVVNVAAGGANTEANMRAVHARPCHQRKTAAEAAAARTKRPTMRRPPEPHPGLLP